MVPVVLQIMSLLLAWRRMPTRLITAPSTTPRISVKKLTLVRMDTHNMPGQTMGAPSQNTSVNHTPMSSQTMMLSLTILTSLPSRVAHRSGTGRRGPTWTRTRETRTRTGTGTNPHRLPAGFEQHHGYPQTRTVISLFSYFFIDLSCFLLFSFFFVGLHRLYLFYSMYYTICNYVI